MTMLKYLDNQQPELLPWLIANRWSLGRARKIIYLTDTVPFGMEERYKKYKDYYIYTNLSGVQCMTVIKALFAEYDEPNDIFRLSVKHIQANR